jgi:ABC-type antimicrobial peptide transport system permease subunit
MTRVMNLFNAILVGFKDIWAHKFRTLLTMLGIILGVASLVGMSALVKGMENGLKESMIAMGGADKVLLDDEDVPAHQEHLADQATGRTMVDVLALRSGAPLLSVVSPEMRVDWAMLSRGDKFVRPSECVGVWPAVVEMNLHTLEHGRFFTDLDEENANPVCVIGTGIRDELFGSPDELGRAVIPIGEIVHINGQPFTIVGMFQHYESERERKEREQRLREAPQEQVGPSRSRGWGRGGSWAFWRKNYTVYMPLNTAWVRFRSASGFNNIPDPRLTDIDLKVANMEQLETALQQARNILLVTHNGIEDFSFRTQENQIESINQQIRNTRLSGGVIAMISLIVGGIGIMNIMLASINERIREIGICKAVGATAPAVFTQILVESIGVSVLGALFGLGSSVLFVRMLEWVSPIQNAPVITAGAMVTATVFSIAIGVVAGLWPAVKAASLDPIQALRYE